MILYHVQLVLARRQADMLRSVWHAFMPINKRRGKTVLSQPQIFCPSVSCSHEWLMLLRDLIWSGHMNYLRIVACTPHPQHLLPFLSCLSVRFTKKKKKKKILKKKSLNISYVWPQGACHLNRRGVLIVSSLLPSCYLPFYSTFYKILPRIFLRLSTALDVGRALIMVYDLTSGNLKLGSDLAEVTEPVTFRHWSLPNSTTFWCQNSSFYHTHHVHTWENYC